MYQNDYYSDFRYLSAEESLTCIIGAVGEDGCVIVSDRRETIGTEIRDVSKIHPIWNNTAVMAGAGDARLLYKLRQSVSGPIPVFPQVLETIEDEVNKLRKHYAERIESTNNKYELVVLFMGLKFDRNPYMHLIYGDGLSSNIEKFEIIGHGAPYVKVLFNLLYHPSLKVNELAVLAYFCIATLVSSKLDQTVGMGQKGPDIVFLKAKEEPELSPLDSIFDTARTSSECPQFHYKLVKSIWNQVPQAFENVDKNML